MRKKRLFGKVQEWQRVARHHRGGKNPIPFLGGGKGRKAGIVAQGVATRLDRASFGGALHLDLVCLGVRRRFHFIGGRIGIDDALLLVCFGLLLLDDGLHARLDGILVLLSKR